jgi:hypothetical protein
MFQLIDCCSLLERAQACCAAASSVAPTAISSSILMTGALYKEYAAWDKTAP